MNDHEGFQLPEELSFSYGYGQYEQGTVSIRGMIVLGQHKLFLKGEAGEVPQTYIPLERIYKIRRLWPQGLEIHVRPSQMTEYAARIRVERPLEKDLLKDLARRRNLKRRFLRAEWFDPNF
ncbi:MAG TPA: hypothetical protein P5160_05005 [Candidatus Omnitrophota bacterium]|jgi:hypothetical protein|nr:hypothetical protein [Candidatus Omnitrophota bacterium]